MTKQVDFNGNKIEVKVDSKEEALERLSNFLENFDLDGNKDAKHHSPYKTEPTNTVEEVKEEQRKFEKEVYDNLTDLANVEKAIQSLNVKKNGRFKKGAINVLYTFDTCSSYFTDYTNAWYSFEVVVKALDENTVEVFPRTTTLKW